MKEFLHILLHGLKDSLKILPIILAVYFLIELLEYKNSQKFNNRFLSKNTSPIYGALFGSLPQCGFSVVATDLYTKKKINVGALLAVYIATSDEAIPVMLTHISSIKIIIPLIITKIVIAIAMGYFFQFVFDKIFYKSSDFILENSISHSKKSNSEDYHHEEHLHIENKHEEVTHLGCCNHDIEHKKYDWKHPLLHSIKIILTILIINIIFGCVVEFGFKGEENLSNFLSKNTVYALQPILAMLIGFIPNCAASVVITEMYIIGGLSFGSLVAGLIVNAGLGIIILIKQNKNIKENLFVITSLILTSLSFGYLLHLIF